MGKSSIGLVMGLALIGAGVLLGACDRPQPVREGAAPAPVTASAPQPDRATDARAVVLPSAPASAVAPVKKIPWTLPNGPLGDPEQAISGTWVARVDQVATRSAAMADKVMLDLGQRSKDQGLVDATVAAMKRDARLPTNCIWLEFFPDRHGIRRGCAMVKGEPSALDKTDPIGGQKSEFGTRFQWYFDLPSKEVRIRFDQDMLVPSFSGGGKKNLRFRHWSLSFGKRAGKGFRMVEKIPEHDLTLPQQYVYEIFPGSFLNKR